MHNTGRATQQFQNPVTTTDPRMAGRDHNASTTLGTAAAPIDFSFEDDEPVTVAPDEIVVDNSPTTGLGVTNASAVHKTVPISEQIEPETQLFNSLQGPLLTDSNEEGGFKRPETSDHRQDSLTTTSDQLPIPDAVLEMPCMDCGEEVENGHKAGCHLGKNLYAMVAIPM
jgi:hypothetical protein